MSYPKANLGAIVLPCDTGTSLTLEEYKTRFGIDLLDFFYASGNHLYPKEGISKPIYFLGSDGRVLALNFTRQWENDDAWDVYGGVIFTEDDDGFAINTGWGLVFTNAESVELWEY